MNQQSQSSSKKSTVLGSAIRQKRRKLGYSINTLSQIVGIADTTLLRIERGDSINPNPVTVRNIAHALNTSAADLYALAGYESKTSLPTFAPYLRSKYRDLPAAAAIELETAFEQIASKYGYDPHGPAPGDDE